MNKEQIYIKNGILIDGVSHRLKEGSVLIEGNRVKEVGDCKPLKSGKSKEIDATGCSVMPGLIDCHIHLTFNGELTHYELFLQPISTMAIKAAASAKKYVETGFTTVRDLGSFEYIGVSVRNCINSGIIQGPRVLSAGIPLTITGGHGELFPPWINFPEDNYVRRVDGKVEIRKEIRKQVAAGVDLIKVFASGGISEETTLPGIREFSDEELKTVVEEAESAKKLVAAHANGEGMKAALRAGIKSIEHGFFLDEEGVKLMKEKRAFLVPTLKANDSLQKCDEKSLTKPVAEKVRMIRGVPEKSFKKALENNIKIAMGTDAGSPNNHHGDNSVELSLMVKNGMSELQAVRAATINAAELLGLSDQIGSIEAGKTADLIIVKGNPLNNISILQNKDNIRCVIKEGKLLKNVNM
ncbi:MAG TPA: amidohydrolase family protein [Thermoplasmata archaeon]|nr:amidohydrolase family protein [Thermoplasmata archaeon]